MKLTEGLGFVNNLTFFRFFFFCMRRFSLNISKCHEELSDLWNLFLGHISSGGLGRKPLDFSWIDVNASKSTTATNRFVTLRVRKKRVSDQFLELDTCPVRSLKVYSKSSRLAEMGK